MWLLQAWFPTGLSFVVTLDKDHSFLPKSTRVSNCHRVGASDLLRLNPIVCPSYPRSCCQKIYAGGFLAVGDPLGCTLLLTCSREDVLAPLPHLPKKVP